MSERGKGKKCGDCANWKVKDSPCSYQEDIRKGVIVKIDPACEDFYPKGKEKPKLHKASGYAEQGHYEAIYNKGKPAFLTIRDKQFRVLEEVTMEADIFCPKSTQTSSPMNHLAAMKRQCLASKNDFGKLEKNSTFS